MNLTTSTPNDPRRYATKLRATIKSSDKQVRMTYDMRECIKQEYCRRLNHIIRLGYSPPSMPTY